jgi:hypothetical protein
MDIYSTRKTDLFTQMSVYELIRFKYLNSNHKLIVIHFLYGSQYRDGSRAVILWLNCE